jgi:hypothetical protein
MSSEENFEKKKKKSQVDGLELGRLMGVIARVDPELYEAISKIAEETNDTPTNVVVKSLKNYFLIQKVEASNMNVGQLLIAFDVFTRIAEMITRIYTSLGALFFSEMTNAIGSIIDKRVQERLEAFGSQGGVVVQGERKPSELEVRLKNRMFDILEAVVEEVLKQVFKISGLKIPEQLKAKIPVEIHIEEEKKEEKGVEVKVT